jgi:hypothetical protein
MSYSTDTPARYVWRCQECGGLVAPGPTVSTCSQCGSYSLHLEERSANGVPEPRPAGRLALTLSLSLGPWLAPCFVRVGSSVGVSLGWLAFMVTVDREAQS